MIGVAISTHNRKDVFEKTYSNVLRYLPKGAELVVVDDCSEVAIKEADYRFESNVGAPTSKNKCIELLIERGCEHLFLFDDDCFPIVKGWEKPYINSGEKHLCFTWEKSASGIQTGHKLIKSHRGLKQYSTSCGCMMYIHKSVIDTIGVFDVNFPKWGGWHHDFTERAFNAGLISFAHLDVSNSCEMFHSMDFFEEISSNYNGKQKAEFIKQAQDYINRRGEALVCKIGVAITTHNRREVFYKNLINIQKHLPKGAELVIVDDCSDVRVPNAYRFSNNVGISVAKNKCIELLLERGCEHLFLFDDDCYPIVDGWELPYINSGEKHLSFTWAGRHNYAVLSDENGIKEYSHPCGCMLYIHKDCIDAVGGFDMNFPLWGNEHVDFSTRVFNYGITSKKYMDVSDSLKLFYAGDFAERNFVSTVARPVKNMLSIEANKRSQKLTGSKAYRSFKTPQNGVILACYFTTIPDPQRNGYWTPNIDQLTALVRTAQHNGCDIKIFHDCFNLKKNDIFVKVSPPKDLSPYLSRWNIYREWLKENQREAVFMVDGTDVEVLKYPFNQIDVNTLYVADEVGQVTSCKWMKERESLEPLHLIKDYQTVINQVKNETLLNCGIIGGSYGIVMDFLDKVCPLLEIHRGSMRSNDMATVNYLLRKCFSEKIYHGIKLNTGFKRFETNNISLFKHK